MPGDRTQDPAEPTETIDVVVIDLDDDSDRWRYTCPNQHRNWARTNSHLWCQSCRRQHEAGEDMDPEHYEVLDQKTGELIPWENVRVAGEGSWASHAVGGD